MRKTIDSIAEAGDYIKKKVVAGFADNKLFYLGDGIESTMACVRSLRKKNVLNPFYNLGGAAAIVRYAPKIVPNLVKEEWERGTALFRDTPVGTDFSDLSSAEGSLTIRPILRPGDEKYFKKRE
jgi:hypothetical protein